MRVLFHYENKTRDLVLIESSAVLFQMDKNQIHIKIDAHLPSEYKKFEEDGWIKVDIPFEMVDGVTQLTEAIETGFLNLASYKLLPPCESTQDKLE